MAPIGLLFAIGKRVLLTLITAVALTTPPSSAQVTSDVTDLAAEAQDPPELASPQFKSSRTTGQIGAMLALGTTWYQWQIEANKLDFDFDRTPSDQVRRFTPDGLRFDDNEKFLNVGHAFVGAYYHQFARANQASMAQAIAVDLAASSVWEALVEHREVFSVNDMVMTGLGGIAVGESLYRVGNFFARSRPSLSNLALMGVFSPASATARFWDDAPASAGWDNQGLATDATHRFSLGVGQSVGLQNAGAAADSAATNVRLNLDLVDLAIYGHEGSARRNLRGGEFTHLQVAYCGNTADMDDLAITARSSLWGHYRQNTTARMSGDGMDGVVSFVGLATAFDLSFHDFASNEAAAPDLTDFLTVAHLLGPAADVTLYRGTFIVRANTDAFVDFALVRPAALQSAASYAAISESKSILRSQQYTYSWGATVAGRMEAMWRKARAGSSVEFGAFDSIEGLDRHEHAYTSPTGIKHEGVTDDVSSSDTRTKVRMFAQAPIPKTAMNVGLGMDHWRRTGKLAGFSATPSDTRLSLMVSAAM